MWHFALAVTADTLTATDNTIPLHIHIAMTETSSPEALRESLRRHQQDHVLRWWDELSGQQRSALADQIESVDFSLLRGLLTSETVAEDPLDMARRADPPAQIVRSGSNPIERAAAKRAGEEILRAGRAGALLVAGGQGTRLGFPHPKGMFPLGPVSNRPLFQILAEQLLARSRNAGVPIPYYIMTSDATHQETVAFFEEHGYFGLSRDDVFFFRQGNMPAVEASSGRLLLAEKGQLSVSPDGHGGMLAALDSAGLFEDMRRRGVDFLHYHQVDNPTAIVCDPVFLGFHAVRSSELSTKVVAKVAAEERMGVLVDVDGQTRIVEYSDMPEDVARQTDDSGSLRHWAGNTAVHVFSRSFLERIIGDESALPFHLAKKAVPHVDENGQLFEPEQPNAVKFERFIFDALPLARSTLIVEVDRATEFSPVKNKDGADSPETAQAAMIALHRAWIESAGARVAHKVPVEIGGGFALDAEEAAHRIEPGTEIDAPAYLG